MTQASTATYEELLAMVAERDLLIEELKAAKEYVNAAKDYYLKIFEDFPALIWRARLDKKCDYFNHTWLEFTGRTMEQEFGDGWAEGVHPDDLEFCVDIYVTNFDKREPFVMEYRLKNKEGEYRWIRDFGRPFYDLDNNFAGYIGSCYDITEYKNYQATLLENAENLQKAVATKDHLFSIIAHDLKAPLGNILSMSEVLTRESQTMAPEKLSRFSEYIFDASSRLEVLLNNLLDWSRSQRAGISVNYSKTSIREVFNDLRIMIHDLAYRKSVEVVYPADNFEITTDPNLLKTILRNLLSNAIKFSYAGSKVRIECAQMEDKYTFSVSDEGVGIEKERLENLFVMGTNKSTAGTGKEKGTGLGLVVCKEFTDLLNGKLYAESEPGKGCTFHLHLPVK